jgi:hypothetical protein
MAAVHVRFDRTAVSNLDLLDVATQLLDDDPQLVAENPGIVEKGLPPAKSTHIGTADSDPFDPDHRLVR